MEGAHRNYQGAPEAAPATVSYRGIFSLKPKRHRQ
jgi:hypothetical protein